MSHRLDAGCPLSSGNHDLDAVSAIAGFSTGKNGFVGGGRTVLTDRVLLLVTGSSCSGKSTVARGFSGLKGLEVHDSDEHGVPSDADTAWRQRDLQRWVRHAIDLDEDGGDVLLTGQSPLGELLAVPHATELDLAVCLLDVEDVTSPEISWDCAAGGCGVT